VPITLRHIIFSDSHIEENCLSELEQVFLEILRYRKEAPILVCTGDYYEKKNPTAREIEFGTKWAKKFVDTFAEFYMITGNHTDIDEKMSSVSYLSHIGVHVSKELVLDDTYYGHFMVKESSCGFNEKEEGSELTSVFELSILGHQHSFQVIAMNSGGSIVHPGSCRYVDFGEVKDKGKYILLNDTRTFQQIRLNKVRPMLEVNSVKALENVSRDAQVRLVIDDLDQFLTEINDIEKIKSEFFKFKTKLNFTSKAISSNSLRTDDIIQDWLNNINHQEVKNEIQIELKNAKIC